MIRNVRTNCNIVVRKTSHVDICVMATEENTNVSNVNIQIAILIVRLIITAAFAMLKH